MRAARAFRKERSQDQTRATGVARSGRADLHDLSQMAGASAQVQQQRRLQRMSDIAQRGGVLQGQLYANFTYPPDNTTLPEFQALDAKVAAAEANATTQITSTTKTTTDTAKQMGYKRRPNPTTWGYVVEEQLDIEARTLGWSTQSVLLGGRPDYKKTVGQITLYADLTTLGQSGTGGPHVGSKLSFFASQQNAPLNCHAADIVHSGTQPGQAPAPLAIKGTDKTSHRKWFGKFKAMLSFGSSASYDPWMQEMQRYYGNHLPHSTFYGRWGTSQRDAFVRRAVRLNKKYSGPQRKGGGGKVRRTRPRRARFSGAYPY